MAVIGAIRQRVGLLILIIALAIIAFLLMDVFSGPGSGGQQVLEAGSVNGMPIDYGEYQTRSTNALEQSRQTNPNMTDADRARVQQQTWDSYVKELLAGQEYEKLGIGVSQEEMVDLFTGPNPHRDLANTPLFKNPETGVFEAQRVKDYVQNLQNPPEGSNQQQVRESSQQWSRFTQYVRKDQQRKKYMDLLKKGLYVPAFMAKANNQDSNKKVDINYVVVPYTQIDDSEISYSDTDLQNYLSANPAKFKQTASSNIDFITFPIEPSEQDRALVQSEVNQLLDKFRATQDDSIFVKLYSDNPFNGDYLTAAELPPTKSAEIMSANIGQVVGPYSEGETFKAFKVLDRTTVADSVDVSHIVAQITPEQDDAAARAKIESLRAQALAGADFEELAVNNSESATVEGDGGYIGMVTPSNLKGPAAYPNFRRSIFKASAGELLTAKTPQGWHLIKVNSSNRGKQAVKVAFLSKGIYASDATIGTAYAKASNFASNNQSLSSFRSAAEAEGFQMKSATNIENSTANIVGLGANDQLASWAYASDVGDVSQVFTMDDKYVIAAVTQKHKKGQSTVDGFRNSLEPLVINQKKAEKIMTAIGASPDMNSVASQYSQAVDTYPAVTFTSTGADPLALEPELKATALAMDANSGTKVVEGYRGVYVFNVGNVQEATEMADVGPVQQLQASSMRQSVEFTALEALKKASDVEDQRHVVKGY